MLHVLAHELVLTFGAGVVVGLLS